MSHLGVPLEHGKLVFYYIMVTKFSAFCLSFFQKLLLTFARTFSKDAGLTKEKHIKNTSCRENRGKIIRQAVFVDIHNPDLIIYPLPDVQSWGTFILIRIFDGAKEENLKR